jgi:HEXXH motif-containing protein
VTVQEYVLTEEQFRSLARGTGSAEAVALLVDAQLSRRRLSLLAAAEQASTLPAEFTEVLSLVARIDRTDPAAGRDLLRHPFLDAWFAGLAASLSAPDIDQSAVGAAAQYLGALAAATAASAGIPFRLRLSWRGEDLVLPGLGTVAGVGSGRLVLHFDGTVLEVAGAERAIEIRAPFRRRTSDWRPALHLHLPAHMLEILDADPLRDRYPAPPLDPMPFPAANAFAVLIAEAWQLLMQEQPEHVEGMRIALRALVPLRRPPDGFQVSASVRGCFGAIGLSVPAEATVAAELLVHEFQHEKLGALLDLIDLCDGDGPARFCAPWRPEPRPASALMQGVYAFAGVAGYWRVRRLHLTGVAQRQAQFRFAYWREQVSHALAQLLGSGELTPSGTRFFTGLNATIDAWREESPATEAARLCSVTTHVAWRLAHQRSDPADVTALARVWTGRSAGLSLVGGASVVPGATPAGGLARILEDAWLYGSAAVRGATEAERAIVDRDHRRAVELLAVPRSERDWVALAVALGAGAGKKETVACRRPELLRAVSDRIMAQGRAPEPALLAPWLSEVLTFDC